MVEHAYLVAVLVCGLAVAAAWDVARRRVPNLVVAPLAALGLAAQWSSSGPQAALLGLAAGAGTLLLLLAPWALGALGGGDAKLAAATAVWLGPSRLSSFLLYAAVAGAPVALAAWAVHRLRARRELRRLAAAGLSVDDARLPRQTAPVAVAIALGALAALRWGSP